MNSGLKIVQTQLNARVQSVLPAGGAISPIIRVASSIIRLMIGRGGRGLLFTPGFTLIDSQSHIKLILPNLLMLCARLIVSEYALFVCVFVCVCVCVCVNVLWERYYNNHSLFCIIHSHSLYHTDTTL